jgi:hypothetical protein
MRLLNIFLLVFLFSCKEETKLPDNIAIAQWDLRDKYDSILGSDTFTFPKLLLFKNNKIYVYRSTDPKPIIDYDNKSFEYGECQGTIPTNLLTQIKNINPNNLDTLYPYKGEMWHDIRYAVVDLKASKYCLFIPQKINKTTFQAINQFLKYSDTVKIKKTNDTLDLHIIRETIYRIAQRHSPEEIPFIKEPPVVN